MAADKLASGTPEVEPDKFRPGGWSPRYIGILLIMILVPEFGVLLALYPVNALTQIATHYGTDQVAWIPAIISLGAVLSPMIGKLADRYGKKRVLLIVIAISVIGLVISTLAPTYAVLIVGRIIQAPGMAIGFLIPSLARDIFPTRTVAFAAVVSVSGASILTVGAQLLVGQVIENFGFAGTFGVTAVVGVAVIVLVGLLVPESSVRDRGGKIDVLGAMLLGVGVGAILLGVSFGPSWGWASLGVVASFALGVVTLAAWVLQARRTSDPIVDLGELRSTSILMTLAIAGISSALSGWFYAILPIIVLHPAGQWGLGLDPTQQGVIAALWSFGGACGGLLGGYAMGRVAGPKVVIVSMSLMTATFVIALFGLHSVAMFTVAAFLAGVTGAGTVSSCMYLMMRQVPARRQATMSSVVTLAYGLSSAAVPVILFAVMNALGSPDLATGTIAYSTGSVTAAIMIPAVLAAVGLVCALVLSRVMPHSSAVPLRYIDEHQVVSADA